ncbi:MAG: amidohydrolase family protein [Verrucomicrobia bacterium]|nr:amidohydrolase family protein [Verrucomicrobiota bacterium]
MAAQLITNVRIVEPGTRIYPGQLLIHERGIAAVGPTIAESPPDTTVVDGHGGWLTPGLIDVHTHGIMQYVYETGEAALHGAGAVLGRFGVTAVVPTVVPQIGRGFLEKLEQISNAVPSARGVRIVGLHLEGPFVAITGAACATVNGDIGLLVEMVAACRGRLKVMSVSPETPNILPIIRRLREQNIRVFLTHTRATPEQTLAAIDAGATHATHFYDVFPVPPETDPGVRPVGVVETVLADRRVTVDFIADGVHVHPMAIRAAVAAKGFQGVTLISDSNVGAGLPPGVYDTPWGYPVRVRDGDGARHAEKNFLAGSALTMDRGIANLLRWLDLPAEQVWAMGTANPARLLGLETQGTLEVGTAADLVLWNADLRPVKTWIDGECVYEGEKNLV